MKISTRGRYALRMLTELARRNTEEYVALKDISRRQDIPVKYLEQIAGQLSKAGFLKSVRGPQGGYRLARAPRDCRIGDILRLLEGDLAPVACLRDTPNRCPRYESCPTAFFWEGLDRLIAAYVDSVNLQQLIEGEHAQFT